MNTLSEQSLLGSSASTKTNNSIRNTSKMIDGVPLPSENLHIIEKVPIHTPKHAMIMSDSSKVEEEKKNNYDDDDSINLEDLFPSSTTTTCLADDPPVISDVEDNKDESEEDDQSIDLQVNGGTEKSNKQVLYAMNSSMNLNCSFRRPAMCVITQSAPASTDVANNFNASDREIFFMSNSQLSLGSASTEGDDRNNKSFLSTLNECSESSSSDTVHSGNDDNDGRSIDMETLMTDKSNTQNTGPKDICKTQQMSATSSVTLMNESSNFSVMEEDSFTHFSYDKKEEECKCITIESRCADSKRCYVQHDTIVQERSVPIACVGIELENMAFFESLVTRSGACLDQIVRSMKQYPGCDAACQGWVCSSLAKWARNSYHREIIVKNGGLDIILRAMSRYPEDASVQIQACRALGNLCYECEENANALYELGFVAKILNALDKCYAIADVHSKGYYALLMAFHNSSIVELATECGGIELILRGMKVHSDDATVQKLGCAALWYLIPCCKDELNNVVVSILNFAMGGHSNEASVQKYALAVLGKCIDSQPILIQEYSIDLIDVVAYCIEKHHKEPSIAEHGCAVLSKIAKYDMENVFMAVASLDLVPLLIESIRNHCMHPQVLEEILCLISKLAKKETVARNIFQLRGIASVVAVMMANTPHGGIQYEGCQSILNLSKHRCLQKKIGDEGGVYAVVDAMRFHPHDEDIQKLAVGCLSNLISVHNNIEMLILAQVKFILQDFKHDSKIVLQKVELIKVAISKTEDPELKKRANPIQREPSRRKSLIQTIMRNSEGSIRRRSLFGSIGFMFDKEDEQERYKHSI